MLEMKMPVVEGLDEYEYDECLQLYEYYYNLNYFRDIPFPVENVDRLCRKDSLKYYRDMKEAYDIYKNILGYELSDRNHIKYGIDGGKK